MKEFLWGLLSIIDAMKQQKVDNGILKSKNPKSLSYMRVYTRQVALAILEVSPQSAELIFQSVRCKLAHLFSPW